MKIDINKLTEAELIDLSNRIVERLRLLHQMRSHVDMLESRIGERVEFQPDAHPLVVGILTKSNKKIVTPGRSYILAGNAFLRWVLLSHRCHQVF